MNQKGFSLVQVMVGFALMGVMIMVLTQLFSTQNREVKSLDEKMVLQSLQLQMSNVLSNSTYCTCYMGVHTFNYASKTWNSFPNSLGSSYNNVCAAVGGDLLRVGVKIPPYNIVPTGMSLQNMSETVVGSGVFSANLVITFDQSEFVRVRKDVSVPMSLTVNMLDPIGARKVSVCSSSAASAPPLDLMTLCGQIGGVYNGAATPPCQPAYQ